MGYSISIVQTLTSPKRSPPLRERPSSGWRVRIDTGPVLREWIFMLAMCFSLCGVCVCGSSGGVQPEAGVQYVFGHHHVGAVARLFG